MARIVIPAARRRQGHSTVSRRACRRLKPSTAAPEPEWLLRSYAAAGGWG